MSEEFKKGAAKELLEMIKHHKDRNSSEAGETEEKIGNLNLNDKESDDSDDEDFETDVQNPQEESLLKKYNTVSFRDYDSGYTARIQEAARKGTVMIFEGSVEDVFFVKNEKYIKIYSFSYNTELCGNLEVDDEQANFFLERVDEIMDSFYFFIMLTKAEPVLHGAEDEFKSDSDGQSNSDKKLFIEGTLIAAEKVSEGEWVDKDIENEEPLLLEDSEENNNSLLSDKPKDENEKELFERNFGLDSDQMTREQKEAFSELVAPSKMSWLMTFAFACAILGIFNLLTLDFKDFIFYIVLGLIVFIGGFLIKRKKAFNKYKQTVSKEAFDLFQEGNRLFYPEIFFLKYGSTIRGAIIIGGIIYLFFDWRVGVTAILFSINILTTIDLVVTERMQMKWSWLIFFSIIMWVIWFVYPPK